MQAAPAVSVACHDRGAWARVTAAILGLTTGSLMAWAMALSGAPLAVAYPVALLGGLVVLAVSWRHRPGLPSVLAWDGQGWRLGDAAAEQDGVTVVLDLGVWILIRFKAPQGLVRWHALSESAVGPGWRSLRMALFTAAPGLPRISA